MPGEIVKLPETEKIPQIGWNDLDIKIKSGVINPKLGMELFFCEL